MKKGLAGIAMVLLVAAGVTSYIGHSLARQAFDSQLAELHRTAPLYGMTVNEAVLEQGLFRGHSRLLLAFASPEPGESPTILAIESDLDYGPLLRTSAGLRPGLLAVASRMSLTGLPEASQHRLYALFGPHPLTLDSHVKLSRQVVVELNVPAARVAAQGEALDFSGMRLQLVHDVAAGTYVGELAVGRLLVDSPQARLRVAPARGRFAFTRLGNGLLPGELHIDFPELALEGGGESVTVRDLALHGESRLEQDGFWARETLSVGELIPPRPVRSASLTVEFERIDPQVLVLWSEIALALQGDALSPARWRALAALLLRQGSGFNVRYVMAAPEGELRADLELAYQGLIDGRDPLNGADLRLLLAALEGELRIEADEALLNTLPVAALLPQFMAQGLVRLEQSRYLSEARLEQGRLSVNGVPFPFNGLMRPAGWAQ